MNTLSWLIYSAEAIDSLGTFLAICTVLGCIALALISLISLKYDEEYQQLMEVSRNSRNWLILFVFLGVFVSFLPSKETVYMIAASEIGEEAIGTEEFQTLRQILKEELDDHLEKLKDDDEE